MAKYTISIMDKLLEHAGSQDLTNPEVMTDLAKTVIFGPELNVVSEQYRDRFALGFAQHFLYDEIGLETWAGWRIALMSMMYDNAEIINWTYENLDKTVFSDYRVHKVTTTRKVDGSAGRTTNSTSTTDGTVNATD